VRTSTVQEQSTGFAKFEKEKTVQIGTQEGSTRNTYVREASRMRRVTQLACPELAGVVVTGGV
jgi:hypothetical protein